MPLPKGDIKTPPSLPGLPAAEMPDESVSPVVGGDRAVPLSADLPPAPEDGNQIPLPDSVPAPSTQAIPTIGEVEQTAVADPDPGPAPASEVPNLDNLPQKQAQAGPPAMSTTNKLIEQAAEMGFDGLDLSGFGAFPIISLKDGEFSSTEGWSLGQQFVCYLTGSRKKFIWKNGLADTDPDDDFFYTYDEVSTIKGEQVADILAEWKAKGWRPIKKPYIDVFVRIAAGQQEGVHAALSVPKTSIPRFSKFWVDLMATGQDIEDIPVLVHKGKRVETAVKPFTPIAFRVASS